MPHLPLAVVTLLGAQEAQETADAWSAFLKEYSRLLLSVAHDIASSRDEAMDHYAFVVDRLRDDDFRRLRAYATNGAAEFSTWLVVVAKRLCIDGYRSRVGRPQGTSEPSAREQAEREARRNLANLVAANVDLLQIKDERVASPENAVVAEERSAALAKAISDLDTRDQLLLTLRFEDDFGPERIAEMLGMSTRFHVHRRLKSVLRTLRDSLASQGVHEL